MNSWCNVLCIMMILCAQDYFGVGPVIAGEYDNLLFSNNERNILHTLFENLYKNVGNELNNNKLTNELDAWAKNENIIQALTIKGELNATAYMEWMKEGAKLIKNANNVAQGDKFDALITNAKQEIQQKVTQVKKIESADENKIGEAVAIYEVLDDLKSALKKGPTSFLGIRRR